MHHTTTRECNLSFYEACSRVRSTALLITNTVLHETKESSTISIDQHEKYWHSCHGIDCETPSSAPYRNVRYDVQHCHSSRGPSAVVAGTRTITATGATPHTDTTHNSRVCHAIQMAL